MGVGILVGPALAHTEYFFRVVSPDFVVGNHRHTDTLEHRLLVPGLAHAVTVDGAGFQGRGHLRRRRYGQQHVSLQLAAGVALVRRVVARVQATGGQPVTQLVVVGGHREHHAHVERLAFRLVLLHHRLQGVRLDRVHRLAVLDRNVLLHFFPHRIGNGDAVAVQIHAECGNDVGFGAVANGGPQRLASKHVRAIQLTVNDPVQQDFPVGLGFQGHKQAFFLEIAFLVSDGQRGHVGEFDKAELEIRLLRPAQRIIRHGGSRQAQRHRGQHATKCFFETVHHPSLVCPFFSGIKKALKAPRLRWPGPLSAFARICSWPPLATKMAVLHSIATVLTLS